jgi:poly [ADP-ribose] polymerase 2/3/4
LSEIGGILSLGPRIAPPEAPSAVYTFGKGVYFSDMASEPDEAGQNLCKVDLLLLCEVALGDINEKQEPDHCANILPGGKNSVVACGKVAPEGGKYL